MINVHSVSKSFQGVTALNNVSFHLQPGEVAALLGRNGAGKSTLSDLLLGLTRPDSGTIQIAGHAPHDAVRNARIGAVMQTGGLLPDLTVTDTLRLIFATYEHPAELNGILERTRLTGLRTRRVGALSGGERQRVRLALALIGDPDVLILDEPTTGMDPASRREFWESMHREAQTGKTILFSTHYLEETEDFADRFLVLHHGRLLVDEPSSKFLSRRKDNSTRSLERVFTALTADNKEKTA